MNSQYFKEKLASMSNNDIQAKITRYEWALSKTVDFKQRSVIISVIDKHKDILDERLMCTVDGTEKPVKIWKQIWTGKNLNVDHFRNRDEIPEVKTNYEWKIACENKKPAWCYYDNNPGNGIKYGKLYNWYAVSDPRNIAPIGWHVPTYAEWKILFRDKGDENTIGGELKEIGTRHWQDPNAYAWDIVGFKALPAGRREFPERFCGLGASAIWWTATECHPYRAWCFMIYNIYGTLLPHEGMKSYGYSVRCLKD
jgi:uncharacterized protein (TIGR02145 family)